MAVFGQGGTDNGVEINIPRPVPPSVSSMMRYVDHPVDLCYGLAKVEIPLFEIVEGDIRIPVTLSYHSSGLRAKEYSGWVGLGWTLHCAPSVSCSVQGRPDSKSTFQSTTPSGYEYNEFLWELTLPRSNYDTEPDVYYYRLLDKSGKIVYDNSPVRKPRTIPYEPIKAGAGKEPTTITDDKGFTYEFGAIVSKKDNIPLQWGATKITAPNGMDEATFEYDPNTSILQIEDLRKDLLVIEGNLLDRTLYPPASGFFPIGVDWPFVYEGNLLTDTYKEKWYPITTTKYPSRHEGVIDTGQSCPFGFSPRYSVPGGSTYMEEYCLKTVNTSTLRVEFELASTPPQPSHLKEHDNNLKSIRIYKRPENTLLREIELVVEEYRPGKSTRDKLSQVRIKDPQGNVIAQYSMEYYNEDQVLDPIFTWADYWGYRQTHVIGDTGNGAHEYHAKNMKLRYCSDAYGLINYTINQFGRGDVGAYTNAALAGMLKSVTTPPVGCPLSNTSKTTM